MNKTVELGNGYLICDYDGSGMLEVVRDDYLMLVESDEEAVELAERDGIKIIPVQELSLAFPRRYYGWIDTPENRAKIDAYTKERCSLVKRYDRFKLQWMIDHGHTLEELIYELGTFVEESDGAVSVKEAFEEWELNIGFGSEIWPCFDEWLGCEAQECE